MVSRVSDLQSASSSNLLLWCVVMQLMGIFEVLWCLMGFNFVQFWVVLWFIFLPRSYSLNLFIISFFSIHLERMWLLYIVRGTAICYVGLWISFRVLNYFIGCVLWLLFILVKFLYTILFLIWIGIASKVHFTHVISPKKNAALHFKWYIYGV